LRRSFHSDRRDNRRLRTSPVREPAHRRHDRGGVNVVARAAFLILTCIACVAVGFLLPMVPVISALICAKFWAGLLAAAGALAGMGLSDALLARLETRESGVAPTAAHEKTRPPVVSKAAIVISSRARSLAARKFEATPTARAPG
jgi:hypothetical protein